MTLAEQLFATVPTFRRNGAMSALVFSSLIFGFLVPIAIGWMVPPALVIPVVYACQAISGLALLTVGGVVVTGPVYLPQLDAKGQLETWSVANKIVAGLLLAAWAYFIVRRLAP